MFVVPCVVPIGRSFFERSLNGIRRLINRSFQRGPLSVDKAPRIKFRLCVRVLTRRSIDDSPVIFYPLSPPLNDLVKVPT